MPTKVFSVFKDKTTPPNPGAISGTLDVKATLKVPDGKYFIVAKMNVDNDTSSTQTVDCRLQAGADFDRNIIRLGASGTTNLDNAAVAFTVMHTFSGTSEVRHNDIFLGLMSPAQGSPPNVAAGRLKITAMSVDSIINEPAP